MTEQNKELSLDINDFINWRDDKVTQYFKKYVEDVRDDTINARLSRAYIEDSAGGQLKLNYFLGYSDAIENILEFITFNVDKDGVIDET